MHCAFIIAPTKLEISKLQITLRSTNLSIITKDLASTSSINIPQKSKILLFTTTLEKFLKTKITSTNTQIHINSSKTPKNFISYAPNHNQNFEEISPLKKKNSPRDFFWESNFDLEPDTKLLNRLKHEQRLTKTKKNLFQDFENSLNREISKQRENQNLREPGTFEVSPFDDEFNFHITVKEDRKCSEKNFEKNENSPPKFFESEKKSPMEEKLLRFGEFEKRENHGIFERNPLLLNLEKQVELLSLERDQEKSKVDFLMSKVYEMSEKIEMISKREKKTPKNLRRKKKLKNSSQSNFQNSTYFSKGSENSKISEQQLPQISKNPIPFGRTKKRLSLKELRKKRKSDKQGRRSINESRGSDKEKKVKKKHRRNKTYAFANKELVNIFENCKEENLDVSNRLLNNRREKSNFGKRRKSEKELIGDIKVGKYVVGKCQYEVFLFNGNLRVRCGIVPVKFHEFKNILRVSNYQYFKC